MNRNRKTRQMVLTALMIALMAVLQLTGIGLIRLGVINITFYCTIIGIGTIVLGLKTGMILGAAFGVISLISAIQAPTALVAPLMAAAWPVVIALCILPRLLVPVAAHFVHKLCAALFKNPHIAPAAGAAAGSLCNTVFYLGLMLAGYSLTVADYPGLLATVGTIALTGGIPEAIVAAIVASPVVLALRKIQK